MADFPKVIGDSSIQGVNTADYNGFAKTIVCGATTIAADRLGAMLAVGTSDGLAYVAGDTAARRVVGIIAGGDTNVDGVVATSGQNVIAKAGVFLFANDTGTPITNANLMQKCYVKDYKTVSGATGSNSVIAGTVIALENGKVAVSVGMSYVA